MESGFIKINRQLMNWEWYNDDNCFRLFFHCILKANYKTKKWKGIEIKRGSFITSLKTLSYELNMSISKVRLAKMKLQYTKEISSQTTNKFTLINVSKYEEFQTNNKQTTNKQQTNNKQTTTTKELKELKELKEINKKDFFDNIEVNNLFLEFLNFRKKLKAINTEKSIKLLFNKLKDFDDKTQIQMLENALANSWKSVFPIKNNKESKETAPKPDWFDDYYDNWLKEHKK